MPVYEYRCQKCKRLVSIFRRSFSEATPLRCTYCGGENLTRLISRVAIVKSERDRVKDLSWIDRDLARRFKDKV